jgi:ankyrin repeat protein
MKPRLTLTRLIKSVDVDGISFARNEVRPEDVPHLCAWYWTLHRWEQKLAIVNLLQDQYHPSMEKVCLDALRAPGDGADWVALPKIISLGVVSEDHDNFALYYSDRAALRAAVDEVLARHGLEREPGAAPEPASPARDHGGEPPLIAAIMAGDETEALRLLGAGADPNVHRVIADQAALWWAASQGMTALVEALLARGAEVDAADRWHSTPLICAATSGHVEVMKRLLDAGADPIARISDGRTALNLSVRSGKPEPLALLLDAGADLDSPQPIFTPLAFACFEGTTAQVELLVSRGADVDRRITDGKFHNVTPLMLAANAGNPEMVQALLGGGADLGLVDDDGKTAADWAQGKRAEQIRELLLK